MLQRAVSKTAMLPSTNMTLAWINSPAIPAGDIHDRGISVPAMNGMWGENFRIDLREYCNGYVPISVQQARLKNLSKKKVVRVASCKSSRLLLCPMYIGKWTDRTFTDLPTISNCVPFPLTGHWPPLFVMRRGLAWTLRQWEWISNHFLVV